MSVQNSVFKDSNKSASVSLRPRGGRLHGGVVICEFGVTNAEPEKSSVKFSSWHFPIFSTVVTKAMENFQKGIFSDNGNMPKLENGHPLLSFKLYKENEAPMFSIYMHNDGETLCEVIKAPATTLVDLDAMAESAYVYMINNCTWNDARIGFKFV